MPASLIAAALWTFGALSAADSTPKFVAPKTLPELEARIKQVLDSTKVPGVGLAIVRHDSVIYTGGIGRARVSPVVKATDSTLFRIGSTSKAFVALTAQALVREGKLSLDTPLAKALPGFYFKNPWEATDPVRIVHLLEHTSGFDDNSLQSYANNDPKPLSVAEGLAIDSATRVSRWRPGTRFSYCNTGPAIVALLIEKIEGKPFEQVVQERWFTPIGMNTATYFRPDTSKSPAATLYRADGKTAVPYWHVFIRPAGSINASAHDMAAYVRFLLGRGSVDGKELLPKDALARMERSESSLAARAGLKVGYGLHLYRVADTTGFTWTSHNGGVEGGLSDMSYMPDYGVGYAFQINAGNGEAASKITGLVRAYLTLGLKTPEFEPGAALAASTRTQFGGWYEPVSPRAQHLYVLERIPNMVYVSFSDLTMSVKPLLGPARAFVPVDSLRFRMMGQNQATFAFVRDAANGRPEGFERIGGSLGQSFARVSTASAITRIAVAALWLAGLGLTVVAMVFGALRWVVRKVRRTMAARATAAIAWRVAAATTLCLLLNVVCISIGSGNIANLGTLTMWSAGLLLTGYLYCVGALASARIAWSTPHGTERWTAVSVWTVRGVAMLHVVAAASLVMQGWIGWRTWV